MKKYTGPWPLVARTDPFAAGLVEGICSHGVGHPTPASVKWMDENSPRGAQGSWGVHGCDGCCREGV